MHRFFGIMSSDNINELFYRFTVPVNFSACAGTDHKYLQFLFENEDSNTRNPVAGFVPGWAARSSPI